MIACTHTHAHTQTGIRPRPPSPTLSPRSALLTVDTRVNLVDNPQTVKALSFRIYMCVCVFGVYATPLLHRLLRDGRETKREREKGGRVDVSSRGYKRPLSALVDVDVDVALHLFNVIRMLREDEERKRVLWGKACGDREGARAQAPL